MGPGTKCYCKCSKKMIKKINICLKIRKLLTNHSKSKFLLNEQVSKNGKFIWVLHFSLMENYGVNGLNNIHKIFTGREKNPKLDSPKTEYTSDTRFQERSFY